MVLSPAKVIGPSQEQLPRQFKAPRGYPLASQSPSPLPFKTNGFSPKSSPVPFKESSPPLLTVAGVLALPSAVKVCAHKLPPLTVTGPVKELLPARLTSPAPALIKPLAEGEPPLVRLALNIKSGE